MALERESEENTAAVGDVQPFKIVVGEDVLVDLQARLSRYRPLRQIEECGWDDGIDLRYLDDLLTYWRDSFDWRTQEERLNRLHHFQTGVCGQTLHFVHERGRGPNPLPLLLIHGWPDGFQRFARLIPLLTDPAAHGADAADAFDLVVPSLPGCGFSRRGSAGPPLADFGTCLNVLMTDVLGYARFGAHGGDVGAIVGDQLVREQSSALVGVHFTNVPPNIGGDVTRDLSPSEATFLATRAAFQKAGGGYAHVQSTKPWTLAAALNDSPAGLAAWIVEKMQAWSDCDGDIERRFSKDALLTNVFLYWATGSIGSSFLGYRDLAKPQTSASSPHLKSLRNGVPAGFAIFPKDVANAPREWAERFYDVQRWTEMPSGGHFAAWEEPQLLAEDIRVFFRPCRLCWPSQTP